MEDALLDVMNTVIPSVALSDASLAVSLASLAVLCTGLLLFCLAFRVRARFRSLQDSLEACRRELQSAREEIAEQTLARRESEEKFQAIFDNSPYSIAFNRLDGTYVDVNAAFLARWGLSREEVLGLSVEDLAAVADGERRRFMDMLERDGRFSNMETQMVRPDGNVSHQLFSSSLVSVGGQTNILSTAVDVTSLKEAEKSVRRWREKFDLTTAAARLTFYEYDVENDVLTWSGSMLDVLGYDPEEMTGGLLDCAASSGGRGQGDGSFCGGPVAGQEIRHRVPPAAQGRIVRRCVRVWATLRQDTGLTAAGARDHSGRFRRQAYGKSPDAERGEVSGHFQQRAHGDFPHQLHGTFPGGQPDPRPHAGIPGQGGTPCRGGESGNGHLPAPRNSPGNARVAARLPGRHPQGHRIQAQGWLAIFRRHQRFVAIR